MEMVLLEWGKKARGSDKHSPLLFINPDTKEEKKSPLTSGEFPDSLIEYFIGHNNLYVNTAREWGVQLGEAYNPFFEIGLSVSQQLDIQHPDRPQSYRDIKLNEFKKLEEVLQNSLISGVLTARKQRRNEGLDGLLETTEGVSEDYIKQVSIYVATLKEKPIQTYESTPGHEWTIEQRLSFFKRDQREENEFLDNYKLVASQLRADYLCIIKIGDLFNIPNLDRTMITEAEDIRKRLDELGVDEGKQYLQILHKGIVHQAKLYQKAEAEVKQAEEEMKKAQIQHGSNLSTYSKRLHDARERLKYTHGAYQFYHAFNQEISYGKPELRKPFFTLLDKSQNANLWLDPSDAGTLIERVYEKHGLKESQQIVANAIDSLKSGHQAFFDVFEKAGVIDVGLYLKKNYVSK